MPNVKILYSEAIGANEDSLLPPDNEYPVPRSLARGGGTHMGYDRGGRHYFNTAATGTSFFGMMHMETGAMYIHPLDADKQRVPTPLLKGTFGERKPPRHHYNHNQTGQSAVYGSTIHQLNDARLKKQRQRCSDDDLYNYENRYLGFTLTKRNGTTDEPHELTLRSGTFNSKFTNKIFGSENGLGITMPIDWAEVLKAGLERNLDDEEPWMKLEPESTSS